MARSAAGTIPPNLPEKTMPMSNHDILRGGCLCGHIRYVVSPGSVFDAGWCHCRQCRHMTGSAALPFFNVKQASFEVLEGNPKRYRSSDQGWRVFCGDCGSPVWYQPADPGGHIAVNTGTLDHPNDASVRPRFHMFDVERLPWFDANPTLPRFQDNELTHPDTRKMYQP